MYGYAAIYVRSFRYPCTDLPLSMYGPSSIHVQVFLLITRGIHVQIFRQIITVWGNQTGLTANLAPEAATHRSLPWE